MRILLQIYDLFFPRLCVCCSKTLIKEEKFLCVNCFLALPIINDNQSTELLERKFWGKVPIKSTISFLKFRKKGMVASILTNMKYNNQPEIGEYLGILFGQNLKNNPNCPKIDFLLPIPLHQVRIKERGYNQAFFVSDGISEGSGMTTLKSCLIRNKNSVSQTTLAERFSRFKNMENIFQVQNKEQILGKSIALVDDVLTTGATLESAAITLLNNGAKEISVFTLASAV